MLNFRRKSLLALSAAIFLCTSAPLAAQQPVDTVGRFVTVFGAKMYYLDRGTGPVVVLVHGIGDEAHVWDQSIGPLSKNHRVVALDLIGFGRSDKPLLDYRPDTFVDFLAGFLSALHIERASFVGNSLGGMIAAELALRNPKMVDRLVLVDAAGYGALADAMAGRKADALRLSTRDDYRYLTPFTFYSKQFYPGEADLDAALTERVKRGDGYTIKTTIEALMRRDGVLDGRLGAVASPTLIIWGRGDRLIPLSFGERFRRDIKGSRLQVIEKCGHIPQVECPAQLNAALMQFLPGKGSNQ
jgi:triacylglycerol lipase